MAQEANTGYRSHHETEVLLKDGSRMLLRPIRKDDTGPGLRFYPESALGPSTCASILCLS